MEAQENKQERKELLYELGMRIQAARRANKMTQEYFAEAVELGDKTVSAIECGRAGVSITKLKKICTVLGVSSDSLLFGEQEKNDVQALAERLSRLTPEQFRIVCDVINSLQEAFALSEKNKA